MSILQGYLFDWAFAHLKQSDILSPISAASLNKSLPYTECSSWRQLLARCFGCA